MTTEAATDISGTDATLNATVNPNGAATTYQFEYGTTTSYGSSVPATAEAIGAGLTGIEVSKPIDRLEIGTTYHFRVVANNELGQTLGEDQTFTAASPPAVTTEPAGNISPTEASLNGTVNPEGDTTTFQFEYGATTAYGTSAPSTPLEVGSGSTPQEVSWTISGLTTGSTYHYRLVAENARAKTYGTDQTFVAESQPTATTGEATAVGEEDAVMNGAVDPNGTEIGYQFDYGKTSSYGNAVPTEVVELGDGTEAAEVSEGITGLEPETTYHYRVTATTDTGATIPGADQTFTTSGRGEPFFGFQWGGNPGDGQWEGEEYKGGDFYPASDEDMLAVAKSGAKYWRLGFDCWDQSSWPKWNHELKLAKAHGLTVIADISGRCSELSNKVPPRSEWSSTESPWQQFARALIKHYGYGGENDTPIGIWEVWNEPNRGINGYGYSESGGWTADGLYYGEMLEKVASALRTAQDAQAANHPELAVLMGGLLAIEGGKTTDEGQTVTNKNPNQFIAEAAQVNGLGATFNGVSSHPYAFWNEEEAKQGIFSVSAIGGRVEQNVENVRNALTNNFSAGKSVWITEMGWPVEPEAPLDATHQRVSELHQFELLHEVFNRIRTRRTGWNIKSLLYYNYRDAQWAPEKKWDMFAGLRRQNGTFRKAWWAFQSQAFQLAESQHEWPIRPGVTTGAATTSGSRTATASGTVNSHGLRTYYQADYGKTTAYGHATSSTNGGYGEASNSISVPVESLEPDTTYHYRISATNLNAETTHGVDRTFTTPPSTETYISEEDLEPLNGEPGYLTVKGGVHSVDGQLNGQVVNIKLKKKHGGEYEYEKTVGSVSRRRYFSGAGGRWKGRMEGPRGVSDPRILPGIKVRGTPLYDPRRLPAGQRGDEPLPRYSLRRSRQR